MKIIENYQWNLTGKYYVQVELDDGRRVEFKSDTPIDQKEIDRRIAVIEAEPDPETVREKMEKAEFFLKLKELALSNPLVKDEKIDVWAERMKTASLQQETIPIPREL